MQSKFSYCHCKSPSDSVQQQCAGVFAFVFADRPSKLHPKQAASHMGTHTSPATPSSWHVDSSPLSSTSPEPPSLPPAFLPWLALPKLACRPASLPSFPPAFASLTPKKLQFSLRVFSQPASCMHTDAQTSTHDTQTCSHTHAHTHTCTRTNAHANTRTISHTHTQLSNPTSICRHTGFSSAERLLPLATCQPSAVSIGLTRTLTVTDTHCIADAAAKSCPFHGALGGQVRFWRPSPSKAVSILSVFHVPGACRGRRSLV